MNRRDFLKLLPALYISFLAQQMLASAGESIAPFLKEAKVLLKDPLWKSKAEVFKRKNLSESQIKEKIKQAYKKGSVHSFSNWWLSEPELLIILNMARAV